MLVRATLVTLLAAASVSAAPSKQSKRHNFDWAKIENLFTFGDSYTSEGYQGHTSIFDPPFRSSTGDGPMWPRELVTNYSASAKQKTTLWDYAVSGATVDNTIVNHTVVDIKGQTTNFVSELSPPPKNLSWTGSNSLMAFFIGINDVANSQSAANQTALHEQILDSYLSSVERLRKAGAKQFLFLNTPPFQRAQFGVTQGMTVQQALGNSIDDYNTVLHKRIMAYCDTHKGLTCLMYDTHALFTKLIDSYAAYKFVSGTEYCQAYAQLGSAERDYRQTPPCAPVPQYLWLNDLHPTWRVHEEIARGISHLFKKHH